MKNGKNPTVAQKKIIAGYKHKAKDLNPDEWLVIKNLPDVLVIKHRDKNTVINVPRGGGTDAQNIIRDFKCNKERKT